MKGLFVIGHISLRANGVWTSSRWHGFIFLSNGKFISLNPHCQIPTRMQGFAKKIGEDAGKYPMHPMAVC
ncbi:hypothetical protein LSUCC0031_10495 [Rhodobacterales bacterium LSUCC0031]|nr:hypothetical protein [Rhodobacterales bacterium LSUCC0031]